MEVFLQFAAATENVHEEIKALRSRQIFPGNDWWVKMKNDNAFMKKYEGRQEIIDFIRKQSSASQPLKLLDSTKTLPVTDKIDLKLEFIKFLAGTLTNETFQNIIRMYEETIMTKSSRISKLQQEKGCVLFVRQI